MAPFREKPVKWDGNEESGRYKNRKGYKYDILAKTVVKKAEDMPACFLAETSREAEEIYGKFERLLNDLAYAYSISTNLNKGDLFGEALIGLARAYRDWDPSRSDDFRIYAIYRIKDALGEFARSNVAIVSVPAYVKKAQANLNEIKQICKSASINFEIIVIDQEIPDELSPPDAIRCAQLVCNLINAADRAKVDYEVFIPRISLIPETIYPEEYDFGDSDDRNLEMLEAALVVDKLKKYMDEEELTICNGIMMDKSFEEIGNSLEKSKGWVSEKLKSFRQRMVEKLEDGTL